MRRKIFEWLTSRPNARVRIMLADVEEFEIINALSKIIDESMGRDLKEAQTLFSDWQREWHEIGKYGGLFEVKASDKIGNVSFTFVDGRESRGIALVRPILYHTAPNERPCFWITRSEHGKVFEIYWSKYHQHWDHARLLP
jgi:hypothetical protein